MVLSPLPHLLFAATLETWREIKWLLGEQCWLGQNQARTQSLDSWCSVPSTVSFCTSLSLNSWPLRFINLLRISGNTGATKGWGKSVKLRTQILNFCPLEYSPPKAFLSSSSYGYGLRQLLADTATKAPCLSHVPSPDCHFFFSFYQLGHVFPSTSKFSHASHFDCFPWFSELPPSCCHLLANKLPSMLPLVTSPEPLTASLMVLGPYSGMSRAYPTQYMPCSFHP